MSSASSSPCWHGNVIAVIAVGRVVVEVVGIQVAVMVVGTVSWSHKRWCGGGLVGRAGSTC